MPDLKILCTADLHLGRVSESPGRTYNVELGTSAAWLRLVEVAKANEADAVAIAGDVFDGRGTYVESRQEFLKGLDSLKQAGIPVVAVAGNHDFEALRLFAKQYPSANLRVLGLDGEWESETIEVRRGFVTFVGWSFETESMHTTQFETLVVPKSDHPIIGLVHGEVGSQSRYHPIRAEDLAVCADAWILGHIHLPCAIGTKAAYPGSPQALDFGPGERGPHGFRWLLHAGGRFEFSEVIPLSTAFYEETALHIEPADGEMAEDALRRTACDYADEIRRAHASVESVFLRVKAHFPPGTDLSELSMDELELREESDMAWILSAHSLPEIDLWQTAQGNDVAAEAARLLIGLTGAVHGDNPPEPAWVRSAELLVEQSSFAIGRQFDTMTAGALDDAEGSLSKPTFAELERMSRDLLTLKIEELLREAAQKGTLA